MKDKVTVIGAAIIDVLAGPVDSTVFNTGSMPVDSIEMSFGGDALNEAVIMSRLGLTTEIVTRLGCDEAGSNVESFLSQNRVECKIHYDQTISTGINIVLVDKDGQRSFLTNPQGSLRKLDENDINVNIGAMGDIVCFASMFVSPMLDIPAMERIFNKIKNKPGRKLIVDLTTAKNGEKLEDIRCLLKYVDYLIPNETEAARLTGNDNVEENAKAFIDNGVSCAIIKCGKNGCFVRNESDAFFIPAYRKTEVKDTTGAGDSFVAGFVYGLKSGMELKECCRFGCAVASCNVEVFGAYNGITSANKPLERYREMKEEV